MVRVSPDGWKTLPSEKSTLNLRHPPNRISLVRPYDSMGKGESASQSNIRNPDVSFQGLPGPRLLLHLQPNEQPGESRAVDKPDSQPRLRQHSTMPIHDPRSARLLWLANPTKSGQQYRIPLDTDPYVRTHRKPYLSRHRQFPIFGQ